MPTPESGRLWRFKKTATDDNTLWNVDFLAALEGKSILRLDYSGNPAPQCDRVDGRALAEPFQYCHLRSQHIALVDRRHRPASFVLHAFRGLSDKHARRIHHGLRSRFAP